MNRKSALIRRLTICAILFCGTCPLLAQQQSSSSETIWLVVRHADRDGDKDAITEAGQERARVLAQLAKSLGVAAIYSTDTVRTQDTAKPAAEQLKLKIQSYAGLTPEWFKAIQSKHGGQVVLIVGHSNTCGPIVRGLTQTRKTFQIEEDEYDNLFVVSTGGESAKVIRLRFGQSGKR